ncbi:protein Gemin2 [Drosophila tropicalis]|uniref:protein Gemin2 n=1 Tax=Drosophila tropicalis TaxID=46794 RepID=UPI0035AB99A9
MQNKEKEEESFQLQALEICEPDASFDPTKPPETGEEYLTHMLYERKRCPAVVTRKCKVKPTAGNANQHANHSLTMLESLPLCGYRQMLPTPEWQDAQVTSFQAARSRVLTLRRELSTQKYDQSVEPPLTTESEKWQEFCKQQQPLLSTLLRLSQTDLEYLLEMYATWLPQSEADVTNGNENSSRCIDLRRDVWLAHWLYATLVCLHLPLEPYVFSTLRSIARSCIQLRNQLTGEQVDRAAPYNLIITLIVHVFAQTDLKAYLLQTTMD